MSAELDRAPIVDRLGALPLVVYERLRANLLKSGAFLARRRRDVRIHVIPYDLLVILNALAVIASALAMVAFVLDPVLVAWQAGLPVPTVAFFHHVTRFGKSDWILLSTGIFLIVMLSLDAGALARHVRVRRTARSLAAFYVFVSVAVSGIIANLAKYMIGRARPKHLADAGNYAFDFWSGDAGWASFPSGHATTAMALALALALLFPRLRWIFLTLGFWIAMSRIFIAAHYPSDVLAGGLLGALIAWLFARALAQRRLLFDFDREGRLIRRKSASGRLV